MDLRFILLFGCAVLLSECKGYCYPKYTPYTNDGGGNIVYLDRQSKIRCERRGFAITMFQLERHPNGNLIHYKLTCCKTHRQEVCKTHANHFSRDGGGNVVYLDRQRVSCPDSGYLKYFYLHRNRHADNVRYKYTCCKPGHTFRPFCYDDHTGANQDGDGNMVYLDRQAPKCWSGYYMNRFHLKRPTGSTIRYNYRCCRYL